MPVTDALFPFLFSCFPFILCASEGKKPGLGWGGRGGGGKRKVNGRGKIGISFEEVMRTVCMEISMARRKVLKQLAFPSIPFLVFSVAVMI